MFLVFPIQLGGATVHVAQFVLAECRASCQGSLKAKSHRHRRNRSLFERGVNHGDQAATAARGDRRMALLFGLKVPGDFVPVQSFMLAWI